MIIRVLALVLVLGRWIVYGGVQVLPLGLKTVCIIDRDPIHRLERQRKLSGGSETFRLSVIRLL